MKKIKPLEGIGKPISIAELPTRRKRGSESLSFITSIPKKFAIEVNRSYGGSKDLIRRLEASGQISPGEFEVHVHDEADKKHVFIVHNAEPRAKKRRRGYRKVDLQKVVAYIERKPNLEHTIAEIQEELFGKIGSPRTDPEMYYPALHATMRARKIIEERRGGKFVAVRRADGTKLNSFQESKR